jgi:hypothetical protein
MFMRVLLPRNRLKWTRLPRGKENRLAMIVDDMDITRVMPVISSTSGSSVTISSIAFRMPFHIEINLQTTPIGF